MRRRHGRGRKIPRREFLKKGAQGGAILCVSPMILREMAGSMAEAAEEEHMNIHDLSRRDLERLLEVALGQGGDFAEVFAEYRTYTRINLEEDKL
ncbi:MAG: hypothetical protein AMJ92_12900, partial [candidate division Zixibacteria bacterium SM23_81]